MLLQETVAHSNCDKFFLRAAEDESDRLVGVRSLDKVVKKKYSRLKCEVWEDVGLKNL